MSCNARESAVVTGRCFVLVAQALWHSVLSRSSPNAGNAPTSVNPLSRNNRSTNLPELIKVSVVGLAFKPGCGRMRRGARSFCRVRQMLFSKPCGCVSRRLSYPRNGDFDRRDILCAGGTGFIAALVATLTGASKIAPAQALGSTVPQVDRLAVRIVTDNYVFFFAPREKLKDMTVERLGPQLSDQPPRKDLAAEFGLSFHVESQRAAEVRYILIDFGITPEVLLNNLSILKIDPASFDALDLSHRHYDHFAGLVGFLAAIKGRLKTNPPFFVGGEDCFCSREFGRGGNMGALDRNALRDADLSLMVSDGPAVVADHGFTSGPIALSSFPASGATAAATSAQVAASGFTISCRDVPKTA